jgi:hypothetical protein
VLHPLGCTLPSGTAPSSPQTPVSAERLSNPWSMPGVHANNVVPTRRTRRYQATPTRRANRGTPGILQLSGLALHRGAALHSQPRTSTRALMFVTHWRLQRTSALPPIACRPFRPLAAVSAPATSTRRSRRSTCQPTSLPAHQSSTGQRFHFSGVIGVSRTWQRHHLAIGALPSSRAALRASGRGQLEENQML